MDEMLVDGYPGPGEYVRPVIYDAPSKEELDAIIARASSCEQYIRYTCYQSKLLSDACTSFLVLLKFLVLYIFSRICCYVPRQAKKYLSFCLTMHAFSTETT